jgi:PAS domain S-box-containing protein
MSGDIENVETYENVMLTKNGTEKIVRWYNTIVRNDDGGIVGLLSSGVDITERKHAEEELRFQYEILINMAEAVYLVRMEDGIIVYANSIFEKMFGYGQGEMIGEHVSIVNAPTEKNPQETAREIMGILLEKYVWQGEVYNIRKDGAPFWCHANVSVFSHSKYGKVLLAIHTDITDRKLAEEELHHLNETLEQRVAQEVRKNMEQERLLIQQSRRAAMGDMIGNIAHQWRQPLNALGLLLYNIKDAYRFNMLNAEYLDQAVSDGSRMVQKMSTTISDFSNFFRPDKEIIVFSALKQIKGAIVLVESSFLNNNISIHINAPQDLNLMGFPNEYSQVLLNLLSNAKEAILAHNQPHRPTCGRVDIVLSEQNRQGCVTVRDNGGGVPVEILDRIFDPYFSTKETGTGIGLYMSKMIIERNMKGGITVKNIEGGAEFIVASPLA